MKILTSLLLLLMLGGCSLLSPAPDVTLTISKQGPWQAQDQIGWQQDGSRLLLEIHSPAGVGSARLQPTSGQWPETVRVRLHLTALEGFFATTGAARFDYRLAQKENSQRAQARAQGESPEPIELELPANLFTDPTAPLVIQWVDFYR